MQATAIKTKDQLIHEIKEKILEIPGGAVGRPINLDNVLSKDSSGCKSGSKISISCLFINDNGNVCADMYRSGTAGCVDFVCGLDLNSANEKILNDIMSALSGNRWSVADYPVLEKQKKRNLVSTFKFPFIQKGA